MKQCKDCAAQGVTNLRPAPFSGPRCSTHHREVTKQRRARAHERRTESTFGITGEQYWQLYEAQGQRCYICQWAKGTTKRLAVDHDHKKCEDHPDDQGCLNCVRALLCGPCNQTIGRLGVEALQRAITVLTDPPAQKILRVSPES
jgi:hypothetical protein